MKKFYLILILVLFGIGLHAQEEYQAKEIDWLTEKMWDHYYFKKDSALFYADQIYKFAEEKNDAEHQIQALLHSCGIANYHYDLKRTERDIALLKESFQKPIYKASVNYTTHF